MASVPRPWNDAGMDKIIALQLAVAEHALASALEIAKLEHVDAKFCKRLESARAQVANLLSEG